MNSAERRVTYLHRKAVQLFQWEKVLNKLRGRADQAIDKDETNLRHHILKIWVKKARTEAKLHTLGESENGNWDRLKADFEKHWKDLRHAFLKASGRS